MTFQEADKLMWEILKFLWTCPSKGKVHPYRLVRIRSIQENVIEAIKTGQYILFRDSAGAIDHFLCYWRVSAEDIETTCDGIKPAVRWEGDKLYICEHGNKGGRHSLTRMIQEIRRIAGSAEGVFWHNWNRQQYKVFLHQKGY
jgi:hemolysin-activating ACP:hemolysin acyltransferase